MAKKPKQFIQRIKKTVKKKNFFIHKSAVVEEQVQIGEGTKIWHFVHIRHHAKIGNNCVIAKAVFIDFESEIGDNVKIQNHSIIYHKAILEDGAFIGPNVCFTNDKLPRAITPDGTPKSAADWQVSTIKIGQGASIGGHSVILPGVSVGQFALAGSGSVITKDVPDFALVYGNPARIKGFVCKCGQKLKKVGMDRKEVLMLCDCGLQVRIPEEIYQQKEEPREKKRIWIR